MENLVIKEDTKIGYVYKMTSPSGRIYIGSTIDIKGRHDDYKCYSCKSQGKLYNSLKKYGYDNHTVEIVWQGLVEEMLKQEALFGLKFDVLSKENLNSKLPKINDIYSSVSEDTKMKMSLVHKERFKNLSEEKRSKLGWHRKGVKLSKESIEKRSKLQQIPVIQLDLENNFIKEWSSATSAGKTLNLSNSDICQCCKSKKKTVGGFKWKYLNKQLENKPRKVIKEYFNKNKKAVIQMDLNENFIKNWDCIKDACRGLNITGSHISSCCNKKRNSAHGFKWRYNKDA